MSLSKMNFLIIFTLFFTYAFTNGFVLMSTVQSKVEKYKYKDGPISRNGKFIHIGDKPVNPDVSIVILPGTLVSPDDYSPIGQQLKLMCDTKDIESEISIAKFTLNCGHRFEVDRISKDIIENVNSENIIIVGHSASAAIGIDIASNVNATGLIQWCGTFNSRGTFPWEIYDINKCNIPVLTILAEQDDMLSFAAALGDFNGLKVSNNRFVSYIKDANHMSGIGDYVEKDRKITKRMKHSMEKLGMENYELKDLDRISISWRMAEFISHITVYPSDKLKILNDHFWEKYEKLIDNFGRPNVKTMIYGENTTSIYHNHIHTPPDIILTIIYCSLPEIRPFIHFCTMLIPFIFSYGESISVSPLMNVFAGNCLNNPSIWVKIPERTCEYFSRDINSYTFAEALSEVSDEDRQAYFDHGKQVVFQEDEVIQHVPGCGLIWLCTPIKIETTEDFILVKSPVINMQNRLNTKIISKSQCLELILIKAFG
jgi:hypothetical protein